MFYGKNKVKSTHEYYKLLYCTFLVSIQMGGVKDAWCAIAIAFMTLLGLRPQIDANFASSTSTY
jgi:hypothetical protein